MAAMYAGVAVGASVTAPSPALLRFSVSCLAFLEINALPFSTQSVNLFCMMEIWQQGADAQALPSYGINNSAAPAGPNMGWAAAPIVAVAGGLVGLVHERSLTADITVVAAPGAGAAEAEPAAAIAAINMDGATRAHLRLVHHNLNLRNAAIGLLAAHQVKPLEAKHITSFVKITGFTLDSAQTILALKTYSGRMPKIVSNALFTHIATSNKFFLYHTRAFSSGTMVKRAMTTLAGLNIAIPTITPSAAAHTATACGVAPMSRIAYYTAIEAHSHELKTADLIMPIDLVMAMAVMEVFGPTVTDWKQGERAKSEASGATYATIKGNLIVLKAGIAAGATTTAAAAAMAGLFV